MRYFSFQFFSDEGVCCCREPEEDAGQTQDADVLGEGSSICLEQNSRMIVQGSRVKLRKFRRLAQRSVECCFTECGKTDVQECWDKKSR